MADKIDQEYRDHTDEAYEYLVKAMEALNKAWPNATVRTWYGQLYKIQNEMLADSNKELFNSA